jgi:hypothetical protein
MPLVPNPWLILGVVLAWLASLAAVGYWQRGDGETAATAACVTRENAALVQANATIERLNREARAKEQAHTNAIAEIGAEHAKDKESIEARARDDVARARAGALRLRVPGGCSASGAGAAGETASPSGRRDDPPASELPGEVAANLFQFAADADRDVKQLTACQAVVIEDRK